MYWNNFEKRIDIFMVVWGWGEEEEEEEEEREEVTRSGRIFEVARR